MPDPHDRKPRLAGARRSFLRAAGALALGLAASHTPAAEPAMPAGLSAPAKPTVMPAFELPTTAGPTFNSGTLKGQVTVIRFWASW